MSKIPIDLQFDLEYLAHKAKDICVKKYGLESMSKASLVIRDPDNPDMFIIISNEGMVFQKGLEALCQQVSDNLESEFHA